MRAGAAHLSYCTNVHPGETLAALRQMLDTEVAAVKARVSPDRPFGTGLRLGIGPTAALQADPKALAALADQLTAGGLYVFTVNGFPYGDFSADSVKEAVYRPDWTDPARRAYTVALAEVLAALAGPPVRSLSTVAGGFRPETDEPATRAAIGDALRATAEDLARLADRTGVVVRLCLEPEPWTLLETSADAARFFSEHLQRGEAARAHLALCYDCCHQAVEFEPPDAALRTLREAGVPIGKVQVSSALHLATPGDPAARAALLRFDEPRYLHQVVGRTADGRRLRARDLPELATPDAEWTQAEAWRCHFHVPIWWTGDGALGTTRADWQAAVRAVLEHGDCDHLEIETYSWHVLPRADHAELTDDLTACVAAEFAALADVIAERQFRPAGK